MDDRVPRLKDVKKNKDNKINPKILVRIKYLILIVFCIDNNCNTIRFIYFEENYEYK